MNTLINPDAHSTGDVARRGWRTRQDVFNSLRVTEVAKEREARKQKALA